MRKSAFLLIFSFVLLGFFSCDFAIPKAIEIRGTPSLRFAETVDVGKMFTDLLTEAINKDDRLTIIPCSGTEVITYLIHTELFDESFDSLKTEKDVLNLHDNFPGITIFPPDIGGNVIGDKILINGFENPITLPLSEIGSLVPGFIFSEYKTKLYFSGAKILEKATIKIKIEEIEDGEENKLIGIDEFQATDHCSDIEEWKANKEYTGTSYPSGGIDITIPITGKDIAISFKVYIPDGTPLHLSDFEAGNIKVEVVVWLPFSFKATDPGGADLKFPEDLFFSSEDDLFGREKAGDDSIFTDIIQSLSVNIKFQNNPLKDGKLIIESKDIKIENPISDVLSFNVTEDNMKKINDPANWPFTPQPRIHFDKDKGISFPRVFNITEFGFKAKIRYRIDF